MAGNVNYIHNIILDGNHIISGKQSASQVALEVFTHNDDNAVVNADLAHDYYVAKMSSEDAIIGLFSKGEGGHGSGLDLADMTTGTLNNKWFWGRESSVAAFSPADTPTSNKLIAAYGTDPDYSLNTHVFEMYPNGRIVTKIDGYSAYAGMFSGKETYVGLADKAVIAALGNSTGTWGAAFSLRENTANNWGIIRETSGGGGSLHFTYGTNFDESVNTSYYEFGNAGDLSASTYTKKDGAKVGGMNGRVTSIEFDGVTADTYATYRTDLVTSSMLDTYDPTDGFVQTFFWDTSGRYDSQLFLPVNTSNSPLKYRAKNNQADYPDWKSVANLQDDQTFENRQTFLTSFDYQNITLARDLTDGATQRIGLLGWHPNIAEERVTLVQGFLDATSTKLLIGGGSTTKNAATEISFYTAANNTTLNGSLAIRVFSDQQVAIGGGTSASESLDVTGNIKLSGNLTDGTSTWTVPASTGTLALTSQLFTPTDIDTDYGNETVTSDWIFQGAGALGDYGNIDLQVGDVADYGILGIGLAEFGRTSRNTANLDLDGTVILRNNANPTTSNILFAMVDGANSIRFALPKSAVGNATYNPRSMLIAGPVVADDTVVTVGYWQGQGIFNNLVCDTDTDGADLGVQNDLEVEGDIFTDSIKGSTDNTNIIIDPHGTGLVQLNADISDGTNTFNLPASAGTLALTSDITGTNSGTNTGDQSITNTSDATSHTITLDASGGSVQLIEGSNITLTTGGTGSAGTVTIASTGGGSSPLTTKGDLFTYDTGDQRLAVGTNGHVLTADSAEATGIKWAAPAAPSANETTDTGTAISLAYTLGNYCNMGTANTNTTFTTTGAVTGGCARVKINTSSQPTVTGATLEGPSTWVASTDMYMEVYYDGTTTRYYFAGDAFLSGMSDVTITSIASNEILVWETDEWVNQTLAEAGIAATGHTHTLSNVTDVTATVAEVNLMDLSGLTAGWVLSADTASTASWKAPTKPTLTKAITIPDPVATDDATIFFTPVAITVTDVRSHITGTTNVVFNIGHAATRTGTQLDVFTSDITLTSTAGQSNSTGFNDATIPANSWVWLEVVSVSGTPTMFHTTIEYTED